jgi:hypothetical protein
MFIVVQTRTPGKDQFPCAARHDYVSATRKDFYLQEDLNASVQENEWYWPWFRDGAAYYGPDMFYRYNREGITTFEQLPADIALLDDPTSLNGAPWYNVHRCKYLYKTDIEERNFDAHRGDVGVKKQIKDILESCAWLGKTDDNGDKDDNKPSSLGFAPINRSRIQFRPLKLETYLAFNEWHSEVLSGRMSDSVDYGNGPVTHDPFGEGYWQPKNFGEDLDQWINTFCPDADVNLPTIEYIKSQGDFPYKSWRNHMCRFARTRGPMVDISTIKNREETNNYNSLPLMYRNDDFGNEDDGVRPPAGGLVIGTIDIPEANTTPDMHISATGISYWIQNAENGQSGSFRGPLFQDVYMWRGESVDNKIATGVVGVIGAVCTVGARNTIQFNTTNYIGMSSVFTDATYKRAWGGAGDLYNSRNNYSLTVTTYQSHPREQTIYDPEYFAVHHYNARPDLEGSYNYIGGPDSEIKQTYYDFFEEPYDVNHGAEWPYFNEEEYSLTDGETVYEGLTNVYQKITGLELAIPTKYNRVSGNLEFVSVNSKMFGETTAGGDPMFPTSQWRLNLTRVGKMLPYRYKTTVVTVDTDFILGDTLAGATRVIDFRNNNNVVLIADELPNEEDEATAETFLGKIVIKDQGQDYQVGDIVGIEDYGILFEVTEIESDLETQIPGLISKMKYLGTVNEFQAGALFEEYVGDWPEIEFSIFPKRDKILNNKSVTGLTFGTVTSENGRDFTAYMVNGIVQEKYGIDQKPLYIDRERRISADSPKTSEGTEDFGVVEEQVQDTINISEDQYSSNNEYDLFFHAQNDPSFVWNSAGNGRFFSTEFNTNYTYFGDPANDSEVGEQYIDCSILTT